MPIPRQHYSASEADAEAWICKNLPPPKDHKPTPVREPNSYYIEIPGDTPLYDKRCTGRSVNQPLYKVTPKPPRKRDPFALTWAPKKPATDGHSTYTNGIHHDASLADKDATSPDDNPDLCLYDFTHQFSHFEANAKRAAEPSQREAFKTTIIELENKPGSHRVIINDGLMQGALSTDDMAQVAVLMSVMANANANNAVKEDEEVKQGGEVLGEVGEDGEIVKAGEKCEVSGGEMRMGKKVVAGRLKGKARKEAKKASRA